MSTTDPGYDPDELDPDFASDPRDPDEEGLEGEDDDG
jgi:hypothetical protein